MSDFDAIVLGAGAAGLFCGAVAAQHGAKVLVLDHADEPSKKILISGGGRCNFTNVHTAPDRYLSANPHFAKSALSRYTARDFIALVDAHRRAGQADRGQQLANAQAGLFLWQVAQAESHVLVDRQMGEEGVILKYHADAARFRRCAKSWPADDLVVDAYGACGDGNAFLIGVLRVRRRPCRVIHYP